MERSILQSIQLTAAALVDGEPGTVESFGDPVAELRALEAGCALVDETGLGAVRFAGADAVDFLHRLLANDVRGLAVGRVQRNLLLSAKGKVLHLFDLARLAGDQLLALTETGRAAGLAGALEAYHFAEDVDILDETSRRAPLGLLGPWAEATLARTLPGAVLPQSGSLLRTEFAGDELLVVRGRRHGAQGFLLDAGPERAAALWRALTEAGAQPVGRTAREARRIAAGEALAGVDADDSRYPQEALLEDAFSLAKGCYVGQEVVAKIDTYGGLHRRLVVLEAPGEQPLEAGCALLAPDSDATAEVGRVTSSVRRPGDGAVLAIGFVKLEHEAPGTRLWLGPSGREARVVARAPQ